MALILLISMKSQAQVTMSAQVPPAGILQQSQLWNIIATNISNSPATATFIMRLMDATTGQPVLSGTSRPVTLGAGARQLQVKDLGPITYEYLSPVADRRDNALLPPGKFRVCYSVVVMGDKSMNPQAEDCLNFVVEPVSPPQLSNPVDKSILEEALPHFTWIPPAPVSLFADLNYDMVLVALYENQSAAEAIQTNIPVYRASALRQPFMSYPAGAPVLDTGITYAWMITANNGRQYAAQTDVWTFKMKSVSRAKQVDLTTYIELKRSSNQVVNCSRSLKYSYVNDAGDSKVRYEIICLDQNSRAVKHGNINLQQGNNMGELSLDRGGKLSDGQLYAFRLYNSRNEIWEMKFIYRTPQ
ncbi:hypothetical protein SAMN05660909_01324 [Chitinophaga terrae (ex Kim and Jung 2007)]|uniref:DUF928 domain-containing protein n=1 Tax=Chitinophaga terrae (ex Kim and Jung 2007) TaxID=408074 RepID=A0A1H3ZWR8_9BACT|nr:hypothetical protein [Chitinophaga terrae (ex Kim and Jung 2007)]SEA27744.1 hypothetical protein SAMN05660909_01324 [Chitinophaga terrae (ex Kim and Jung 2007)]